MSTTRFIEIMDTTLRDGEQTSGVAFTLHEKQSITRLLIEELGVNRVEIASARVSDGEFETVRRICQWATSRNILERIEILGFVDGGASVDWIKKAGGKVLNLLSKGSYKHCVCQLNKTPEEHHEDVRQTIRLAHSKDIKVNLYLEDWSNGMLESKDYVFQMIDTLCNEPIERFMLPDTLGVLNPIQMFDFCKEMIARYPEVRFDIHAHNDYELAVANVFSAVKAGIHGVHVTVNGLGERAGNAALSSVLAVLHDQLKMRTSLVENKLKPVSMIVESYSGIRIPGNKPVVGELVFTQCAGVHADGDSKNDLYYNNLLPERFGRTRSYALGKLSGKANIKKNLEELGIVLDNPSMLKVTQRIIELGDHKQVVTQEDLPYIVSEVLSESPQEQPIRLVSYGLSLTFGLRPVAMIKVEINGEEYEESAIGDGQYDAFVTAIRKIYKQNLKREFPTLIDYTVDIPPGGRTDAFVQTVISWEYKGHSFKTRALNADQTAAAIQATIKMLNQIENYK